MTQLATKSPKFKLNSTNLLLTFPTAMPKKRVFLKQLPLKCKD